MLHPASRLVNCQHPLLAGSRISQLLGSPNYAANGIPCYLARPSSDKNCSITGMMREIIVL